MKKPWEGEVGQIFGSRALNMIVLAASIYKKRKRKRTGGEKRPMGNQERIEITERGW